MFVRQFPLVCEAVIKSNHNPKHDFQPLLTDQIPNKINHDVIELLTVHGINIFESLQNLIEFTDVVSINIVGDNEIAQLTKLFAHAMHISITNIQESDHVYICEDISDEKVNKLITTMQLHTELYFVNTLKFQSKDYYALYQFITHNNLFDQITRII